MNKYLTVIAAGLMLMGCATQKPKTAQSNMQIMHGTQPLADKNMICSRSRPMDSHIPELICITPEQAAARKKAAQQDMQNVQNGPTPPFN